LLGEELDGLAKLRPKLPESRQSNTERAEQIESQITTIRGKIKKASENLMFASDARSREMIDSKLTEMWAEHDRLADELGTMRLPNAEADDEVERTRLIEWWTDFRKRALAIPVSKIALPAAKEIARDAIRATDIRTSPLRRHAADGQWWLSADRRAVNEALHLLGAEVRLRWRKVEENLADGRTRTRNVLDRGRFRLGQKTGVLPRHVLQSSGRGSG
jgi:hypothetical protein